MASRKKRFGVVFGILRILRTPRPLRVVIFVVLLLLALPYAITPFYAFGWPVSTVMLWREVTGQRVRRQYVPLSRIAWVLQLAVIAAEDGRFCSHHGIDFTEIREAINDADDLGEVRVSSTITQQVAKNSSGRAAAFCAKRWSSRWRYGSIWCYRSGASWRFTSISPSGARTANSASKRAAVAPLANQQMT